MKFNEIARSHHSWLEQKGWNNTTPLESAGMISSEIGETTRECYRNKPTDKFKEEVADIVLRIIGLTQRYNVDIDQGLVDQTPAWQEWVIESGFNEGSVLEDLSLMNGELSLAINECRGEKIGNNFTPTMMQVLLCVIGMAKKYNIDLELELTQKINKNLQKLHSRLK